jgi:hypothetical protein
MILALDFIKQQASCKQANPKYHQASNKQAISWLVTSKSSKDPMLGLLACCGVCSPLSTAYSTELAQLLYRCKGLVPVKKPDFLGLFWDSNIISFTSKNILKAFEATGVEPRDASVVLQRFRTPSPQQDETT